jgi:guanosine-3',5'-bis(diphosphate) 3'-pyrophosphohydrolase
MRRRLEPTQALLKAMHFAADLHKTTTRKGAAQEPYVNHVIEVAELLARIGASPTRSRSKPRSSTTSSKTHR